MDVQRLVAIIRSDLANGVSKGSSLRAVRQFIMDVERSADPSKLVEPDPGSTGDERWDAFVAGVGEDLAERFGFDVPAWTDTEPLDTPWYFSDYPKTHDIAVAETPAALKRRGVFIRRASLINIRDL